MKITRKKDGQVFTPSYIARDMLDFIGYAGPSILEKHFIDNSCGDGVFLREAVGRYCEQARIAGMEDEQIRKHLETYIHGIEIERFAYQDCLVGLNNRASGFGLHGIKWDVRNEDALTVTCFDSLMDFVVGNPPYIRVHDLGDSYENVKRFRFAAGGMTDLYLVFFEIGFNMLKDGGKMCYITPNSWLGSVAAKNMRQYIMDTKNLTGLIDLGHFQAFSNATTYTLISSFTKGVRTERFSYYEFDGRTRHKMFIDDISIEDCEIGSCFYLSDKKNLDLLRDIKTSRVDTIAFVKNGFATLADDVFIGNAVPKSRITIRTLKVSTGKWYNCIYPYDRNAKLLPREEVFGIPAISTYFETYKCKILKGRKEFPTYYEYGRTQALNDVWHDKVAVNSLLKTENDLKIFEVKAGEGVYSGFYIIGEGVTIDVVRDILVTDEFRRYVTLLKKYKSGGYYTFSSKDVQQYINYKLSKK